MSKRDEVLSQIDLALAHFTSCVDTSSLELLRQQLNKLLKPVANLNDPPWVEVHSIVVGPSGMLTAIAEPLHIQDDIIEWCRNIEHYLGGRMNVEPMESVDIQSLMALIEPTSDHAAATKSTRDATAARPDASGALLTVEQARANAQVLSELRRDSEAALQRRIDSNELWPLEELQDALGITSQSIIKAVKAGRMFALQGPAGKDFYPAFFANKDLNHRDLGKVARALVGVPAPSKYYFFTCISTYLGTTPLEALKQRRLEDVLIAAAAFTER